jgi:hypothetical protein
MTHAEWDASIAELQTSLVGIPLGKQRTRVWKAWLEKLPRKEQRRAHAMHDVFKVLLEAPDEKKMVTKKHWAAGSVAVAVVAILVLSGFYLGKNARPPKECKPGYEVKNGECATSDHPVDQFARCFIQDKRVEQKAVSDLSIEALFRDGKVEGKTVAQMSDTVEKTAEKTENECVLLAVVQHCALLAGGESRELPERCQ